MKNKNTKKVKTSKNSILSLRISTTKAPVGPPICILLPPRSEIIKPAMIAVIKPLSGVTPEAIAKAIASGNATIPTIIPADKSKKIGFLIIPF